MSSERWQELPEGCKFHFFLSHYQATGGDQVDSLCAQLEKRGFRCWYDNKMKQLTKDSHLSRHLSRLPIHACLGPPTFGCRAITQVVGAPHGTVDGYRSPACLHGRSDRHPCVHRNPGVGLVVIVASLWSATWWSEPPGLISLVVRIMP